MVEVRAKRASKPPPPVENPEPIDAGTPGASARREYERRQAKRESRIREKHPKVGGLILAVSDEPQSTTAWSTGAPGEERLGQRLNELSSDTVRVHHDRRIPGTRANIDHLAVTRARVPLLEPRHPGSGPDDTDEPAEAHFLVLWPSHD